VIEELARSGHKLPFHIELIAFAEEEGIRFGTSYLGSSAVAGRFDLKSLDRRDSSGVAVADAIRSTGVNPAEIPLLARHPPDLLGYLEVHIEQGPVLLEAGLALGVVSAIAGCFRFQIAITGVAGHAGTVPMAVRRDALAAAAELALYVEQRCRAIPGVVGTVGQIAVPNGAINVVPGQCELTLDVRADEGHKLDAAISDIRERVHQIEAERNVRIVMTDLQRAPVVPCSPRMQQLLADSLARTGVPVRYLPSGAGHDAVMFNGVTDVGMLFVRCGNGGVSHNPLESVTEGDADLAARVLLDALKNLNGHLK
jgi:hydantoinase/carbamoylase family amidase